MEQIKTYDFSTVDGYKKYLYDVIDNQTQQTIFNGFTFDNKQFSMSISAQINWSNLFFIPDNLFPLDITTMYEEVYVLSLANRNAFYGAALSVKKNALDNGRSLKVQVNECTTLQELIDLSTIINS